MLPAAIHCLLEAFFVDLGRRDVSDFMLLVEIVVIGLVVWILSGLNQSGSGSEFWRIVASPVPLAFL